MEINDFRVRAHEMVDWMADYMEGVEEYPVRPAVTAGSIMAALPVSPPEVGEPMPTLFEDFRRLIVPGMTHWQHPGFFGYFPANTSPPSVLAEMLTATLGAQCMSWETSPAATELEIRMMEWLRQMLGLPSGFTGCIQDTASTATLVAILVARQRASGGLANRSGVTERMMVYCSAEAHSSVQKAVRIAGIGDEGLRLVSVDQNHAMSPLHLRELMAADREAGRIPVAVVACLGTTGTGGSDSLAAISPVCRSHGVWLHVDAAWAGSALILPEYRGMIDGIDGADSFVFNPHKWLFTNFDCSVLFVRDPDDLINTLGILPEYLKTADAGVTNFRDWGVQLGRRFRALKLWFVIRSYGVEGLRRILSNHIAWARELAGAMEADRDFEIMTPPRLSLFCFRYRRPDTPHAGLDALNQAVLAETNAAGKVYLTHTRVNGEFVIRFVAGQTRTTREHVLSVLPEVRSAAGRVNAGKAPS